MPCCAFAQAMSNPTEDDMERRSLIKGFLFATGAALAMTAGTAHAMPAMAPLAVEIQQPLQAPAAAIATEADIAAAKIDNVGYYGYRRHYYRPRYYRPRYHRPRYYRPKYVAPQYNSGY